MCDLIFSFESHAWKCLQEMAKEKSGPTEIKITNPDLQKIILTEWKKSELGAYREKILKNQSSIIWWLPLTALFYFPLYIILTRLLKFEERLIRMVRWVKHKIPIEIRQVNDTINWIIKNKTKLSQFFNFIVSYQLLKAVFALE